MSSHDKYSTHNSDVFGAEARKHNSKKAKKKKKKIMMRNGIPQWCFQSPPEHVKVQ